MLAGQLVLGGPVCSLHTCRKPDGGDSCVYSVLAMTADGDIWMWDLMPLSQAESLLKCVLKVFKSYCEVIIGL